MTYEEWLEKHHLAVFVTRGNELAVSNGMSLSAYAYFRVHKDKLLDKGLLTQMRECAQKALGRASLEAVYGKDCIRDLVMNISP